MRRRGGLGPRHTHVTAPWPDQACLRAAYGKAPIRLWPRHVHRPGQTVRQSIGKAALEPWDVHSRSVRAFKPDWTQCPQSDQGCRRRCAASLSSRHTIAISQRVYLRQPPTGGVPTSPDKSRLSGLCRNQETVTTTAPLPISSAPCVELPYKPVAASLARPFPTTSAGFRYRSRQTRQRWRGPCGHWSRKSRE